MMPPTLERPKLEEFFDEHFENICFDVEQLIDRLEAAEDWSALLICHIYLDHILTRTLKDHIPKIDAYLQTGGHKTFTDKLALCVANELVDEEFAKTFKSINSARNKFAHRLVFEVPDELKVLLFSEFSPTRPQTEVLAKDGFSDFMCTVVMAAEMERVYNAKIAELRREEALNRDQLVDYAFQLFSRQLQRGN